MVGVRTGVVTFLLTDVVGSSELWDEDAETASAAMATHDAIVADAVERWGGARPLEQGEGDSVVAAFDRVTDAAACALDIRARLAEADAPLVRAALHVGEAEVRDDGTYRGTVLNRCARLRAAAHGGQVLISQAVHELLVDHLSEGVDLVDLGRHRLRGLSRPEQVWELRDRHVTEPFPPLATLETTPHNLPVATTSFIGRETEVGALATEIENNRLVTITGSGGCGKTRLVVEVASILLDRHPDGVWYVDLAAVADAGLVEAAAAGVVGVSRSPVEPLIDTLVRQLDGAASLLVLDNCEHLIDASAALVHVLLTRCSTTTIVVTSREPLGLDGELTWRLPSLSVPSANAQSLAEVDRSEAVRLFIDRARAASPGLEITDDDLPFLVDICRRLDGIPLALELAAARTRLLTLRQIAEALGDRFRLLVGGSRGALPRQRTLEASVEWSHNLLSDDEQVLLRQLSVFSGTFDVDAVITVCDTPRDGRSSDGLDLLAGLVDRSLVQVERHAHVARYRLLETIRDFARRRLLASDEADTIRDRHLEHYASLARRAEAGLDGPDAKTWLDRLDLEVANIRAALDWSVASDNTDAGLVLVGRIFPYWYVRGWLTVGIERLQAPVDARSGSAEERARALCTLAIVGGFQQARIHDALTWAEEAVAVAAPLDGIVHARALACLSQVSVVIEGDGADESRWIPFEEAVAAARRCGDATALVQALTAYGAVRVDTTAAPGARAMLEEAFDVGEAHGITRMTLEGAWWLGLAEAIEGDVATACNRAESLIAQADELDDPWLAVLGRELLMWVSGLRGDFATADEVHAATEQLLRRHPTPFGAAFVDTTMAGLAAMRGDLEQARHLSDRYADVATFMPRYAAQTLSELARVLVRCDPERARALVPKIHALPDFPYRLRAKAAMAWVEGRLLLLDGELHAAEDRLHEGLDHAMSWQLRLHALDILEALAVVVAAQERHAEAALALAACHELRSQLEVVTLGPDIDAELGVLRGSVLDELGPERFEHAWSAGATMDLEDIVLSVRKSRGERNRPSIGWNSLTPTETRVVALVAEGLTNPQIGERMHISKRTVQTHVSHVFAKVGVSSRAELAAAAAGRQHSEMKEHS